MPHYGGKGLVGARREVEGIRIRYPEGRVWEGERATAARMVEALNAPGVLHFVGHGLADLQPGTMPELLFGEKQAPLTLAALTRRPIRSRLVVLAACTAAFPALFRDGKRLWARTGPVEALLARGAGAVVASSWLVKDKLSAEQMKLFYDKLDRGPAAALTHSYRELIRRMHPPHPRFWAGYSVYQSAL
jgi:CHAT domain-containing protein